MASRRVHLVGSVPLADAGAVFEAATEALGGAVPRLPDGETGARRVWVNFQYGVLARHPALEFAGPAIDPDAVVYEPLGAGSDYPTPTRLKLKTGVDPDSLTFDSLGYREAAIESYATFERLKAAGRIMPECRFLVALPTPLAPLWPFVVSEDAPKVLPAYTRAFLAEVEAIRAAVPDDQLAIQWDVAVEFQIWEGLFPPLPGDSKAEILDRLAALGAAVPEAVELGYHLCYGDRGHKHFIEPTDTGHMVEVANGVFDRIGRRVDWLHLPVPRDRDDDAYFAPLGTLRLPKETELVLGLVHRTGGVAATRRRMAAAEKVVQGFGIATECGFGRRDPSMIPELLRIHAEAAG